MVGSRILIGKMQNKYHLSKKGDLFISTCLSLVYRRGGHSRKPCCDRGLRGEKRCRGEKFTVLARILRSPARNLWSLAHPLRSLIGGATREANTHLLVGDYTGAGATWDEMVQVFRLSGITAIQLADIEQRPMPASLESIAIPAPSAEQAQEIVRTEFAALTAL